MDCSLQDFSVGGIYQARILEWVVISSSKGSSSPGIEPVSPVLQADSLPAEPLEKPLVDAAAAAKSLQSCPTLCNPTDGSPPGPPILVHLFWGWLRG